MRITFLKVSNKMSALQELKSREEALKKKSDVWFKSWLFCLHLFGVNLKQTLFKLGKWFVLLVSLEWLHFLSDLFSELLSCFSLHLTLQTNCQKFCCDSSVSFILFNEVLCFMLPRQSSITNTCVCSDNKNTFLYAVQHI